MGHLYRPNQPPISTAGLYFPGQSAQPERLFLLEAKATQHWLAGLSNTRIGSTARELYKTLQDFNRSQIPSLVRRPVLGTLLEPVHHSYRQLMGYLVNNRLPMDDNQLKIAKISKALLLELVLSFKIQLRDLLNEPAPARSLGLDIASIIQHTLLLHLEVLRHSALTYQSYPNHFWQETHLLFRLALREDLQTRHCPEPGILSQGLSLDSIQSTSIQDSYAQILLMSLSDHYRMRQQDIILLMNFLPEVSPQLEFSQENDSQEHDRFVILLTKNLPALQRSQIRPELLNAKDLLFMRTDALAQQLAKITSQLKFNNLTGEKEYRGLSKRNLQHLHQVWTQLPARHAPRTPLHFELEIISGLRAIYQHQSSIRKAIEATNLSLQPDISSLLLDPDSGMQLDLDSSFWEERSSSPIIQINDLDYQRAEGGGEGPALGQRFQILNESDGGYCISWSKDRVPAVKIGELLGIRQNSEQLGLHLAVIRWMKQHNDGGMLGIALLSRHCQPMQARLLEQEHSLLHQCLALEEKTSLALPRLVTPPLAFRVGQLVNLLGEQAHSQVRLLELLETSAAFNVFSYQPIDPFEHPA